MELHLVRLNNDMKSALDDFAAEWSEPMVPAAVRQYKGDIKEYMDYLEMMEKDPPRLLVPSTTFFLTDGEKILGAIDIRHFLNSGLARYGGHIGYGVRPSRRGKGLATQMMKLAMPFMRSIGLDRVMMCCKKDNAASAKTIKNCGGVLERETEVFEKSEKRIGQIYWVDIK